jgi:general secretion pathway protein N
MKRMSKAAARRFANSRLSTSFQDSTLAELAWDRSQSRAPRWAMAGVVAGSLVSFVAFAPAAWLAQVVTSSLDSRFVLADARGTVWSGSAVAVLTGGRGSVDASALPGRLHWSLGWRWAGGPGLVLSAEHACCLNGVQRMALQPGWGRRMTISLLDAPSVPGASPLWLGQWPSSWFSGLGTPWNTLQLGGVTRLSVQGGTLQWVQGRWNFSGQAQVDWLDVSSRVSTLPFLGSYHLSLTSDPSSPGQALMSMRTSEGALQLTGSGHWNANGVHFRGEAQALPGDEAALSNLLNIMGRRDGSRSVISIG